MSYIKAMDVLPGELIDKVQSYIDGAYIYIPRKEGLKKAWGEKTKSREIVAARNSEIYRRYAAGNSVVSLSNTFYLSPKSIQRIIAGIKTKGF